MTEYNYEHPHRPAASSFFPVFLFFLLAFIPSTHPARHPSVGGVFVITKVKMAAGLPGRGRSIDTDCLTSASASVRSIRRPGEDPGPCSLRKAWRRGGGRKMSDRSVLSVLDLVKHAPLVLCFWNRSTFLGL